MLERPMLADKRVEGAVSHGLAWLRQLLVFFGEEAGQGGRDQHFILVLILSGWSTLLQLMRISNNHSCLLQ